jgi:hypothetical protein
MNKPLRRTAGYLYLIALCGAIGCTPDLVKKQQAVDFNNLGRIELQLVGIDPSASPIDIAQQVSKNLVAWDYPVGAKDNQAFSHVLKATVGLVEHTSTPTGFSFSSGNSDPRAMDFQKADVLPISCQLTAIAHPEQTAELKLGFSADQTSKLFLASDKLADHISTVCFNLLTELKWPQKVKKDTDEKTIKPPSWMPEIRIETKETPAGPVRKPVPANNSDDQGIDLETNTPTNNEPRKQIIIYNQGSPLILQFGHERR